MLQRNPAGIRGSILLDRHASLPSTTAVNLWGPALLGVGSRGWRGHCPAPPSQEGLVLFYFLKNKKIPFSGHFFFFKKKLVFPKKKKIPPFLGSPFYLVSKGLTGLTLVLGSG